jgi:hypothetical protein
MLGAAQGEGKTTMLTVSLILGLGLQATAEPPTARRFDLECREFVEPGVPGNLFVHRFSIDLDAGTACHARITGCAPVVDHGRWLELSYRFRAGDGEEWEMFRLYDRRTGWLDQVIRPEAGAAAGYGQGDAVCTVQPWSGIGQTADKPDGSR